MNQALKPVINALLEKQGRKTTYSYSRDSREIKVDCYVSGLLSVLEADNIFRRYASELRNEDVTFFVRGVPGARVSLEKWIHQMLRRENSDDQVRNEVWMLFDASRLLQLSLLKELCLTDAMVENIDRIVSREVLKRHSFDRRATLTALVQDQICLLDHIGEQVEFRLVRVFGSTLVRFVSLMTEQSLRPYWDELVQFLQRYDRMETGEASLRELIIRNQQLLL